MAFKITQLGGIARALSRVQDSLYRSPGTTIAGINPSQWPSPMQPMQPIGPPGSQPMGFPFWQGQNLNNTPRFDDSMTAADLRTLSTYPLARICIENAKDQLCQLRWKIQLKRRPGETQIDVEARRKSQQKGDEVIRQLTEFFEVPDGEHDWPDWLRPFLDDMLVIDAASMLIRETFNGEIAELRWIPGDNIIRYIDGNGWTPKPPSPAYCQLWEGVPRVPLMANQLFYKPRNIVPRNSISSYLYGYSPTEQVADEIRIGISRLMYVRQYYESGSVPNMIHVVPPNVTIDKIKETMDWLNSELSGNLMTRRQYRMIQGFNRDGKGDQVLFPKEPVLADVFDDLHIRKLCFAYGSSPQRLMRMMNRASAQVSQDAAAEEAIRPWKDWIERSLCNPAIRRKSQSNDYEMALDLPEESDTTKRNKISVARVREGLATINEEKLANGEDPSDDQAANVLAVTTATGRVPIGQAVQTTQPVERGDPTPVGKVLRG